MRRRRQNFLAALLLRLHRRLIESYPAPFRERFGREICEDGKRFLLEAGESGGTFGVLRAGAILFRDWRATARMLRRPHIRAGAARWPGGLAPDLGRAFRSLRRSPAYSLAVLSILSLTCALGAFSWTVYDGVLLRPLPYHRPEQLFFLWQTQPGHPESSVSVPNFLDLQRENRSLIEMAAYSDGTATFAEGDYPIRVQVAQTTLNFPGLLGAGTVLGRAFSEDDTPGTILLMHGFWTRQFGADPGVVGRDIRLSGRSLRIIGVLEESFKVPAAPEIDILAGVRLQAERSCGRGCSSHIVLARFRQETPTPPLQGLESSMASLVRNFPEENRGKGIRLVSLREQLLGAYERPLGLLMAGLGLILLMVLGNIFCLALSRGARRRREWALREALGGSRSQVLRPAWLEGLWLTGGAAVAGSLVGGWLLKLFLALAPQAVPPGTQLEVGWPVSIPLLLSMLLGTMTLALGQRLGGSGRLQTHLPRALQARGSGTFVLRRALVPLQFAATAILLVGSLTLSENFSRLTQLDPGFVPQDLVMTRIALSRENYSSRDARTGFVRELLDRLKTAPMISSAAAIWLPTVDPEGNASSSYWVQDRAEPTQFTRPEAELRPITPGYFETARIPLLAGRDFKPEDNWTAVPVAIVSRALAEAAWPGQDPLGKRITHGLRFGAESDLGEYREVIGVAGDVRVQGLARPPLPVLYIPYNQSAPAAMSLVLRSPAPLADVIDQVRFRVGELDDQIPLFWIDSLERSLDASIAAPRFQTTLAGLFAVAATLLAVTGAYGVMASQITSQRREVGVRLALGALPRQISRWVLSTSFQLAGPGILAGLLIAWWAQPVLLGLVHELDELPLPTVVTTGLILALASLLASLMPALSAGRIDPIRVLKIDSD